MNTLHPLLLLFYSAVLWIQWTECASLYRYVQRVRSRDIEKCPINFTTEVPMVNNYANYLLFSFVVKPTAGGSILDRFLRTESWDMEEFHTYRMVMKQAGATLKNFQLVNVTTERSKEKPAPDRETNDMAEAAAYYLALRFGLHLFDLLIKDREEHMAAATEGAARNPCSQNRYFSYRNDVEDEAKELRKKEALLVKRWEELTAAMEGAQGHLAAEELSPYYDYQIPHRLGNPQACFPTLDETLLSDLWHDTRANDIIRLYHELEDDVKGWLSKRESGLKY